MDKKIKILLAASLPAMAVAALAGCSGGGAKDKFVISISASNNTAEQSMLNIWKNAYEESHPNVTVKVDGWGGNEGTSQDYILKNAMNRSYLTNIIYTTDDTTAYLAQLKNFVDLRPYYEASEETDYTKYYSTMLDLTSFYGEFRPTTSYQGSYECEKSDDPQYGMYFAPREYNMPGMVCNATLFKNVFATDEEKANWNKDSVKNILLRLGGESEWNWNCFVKACQAISDKIVDEYDVKNNNSFYGYRAVELVQSWEPIYSSLMKDLGGDGLFKINSRDETVQNMDSNANTGAYNKIINAFGKNQYKYMLDEDNSKTNFPSRNIFMVCASYPEVANFYYSLSKVDYEISFMPIPTEYVSAGCGGYGILVDEANKVQTIKSGESAKTADLCWDFIKFIISKEGQNLCGKEGYIQPVLKELADTGDWLQSYDPNLDHSAFCHGKELKLDTFTFAAPEYRNDLRTAVATFFSSLFQSKTTTYSDLLSTAITEINGILK